MRTKTSALFGGFFLILFALPFAGFGVVAGVWVFRDLQDHHAMKSWEEVSAIVVEAELERHRGDDSTTHKATATYAYDYRGHRYTCDRVGISGEADNIGSYQEDWGRKLLQHKKTGAPIPAYVNPSSPHEAILDRELRMGMVFIKSVFALVFSGIGFGLSIGSVLATKKKTATQTAADTVPDQPWMWREDWSRGQIKSDTSSGLWGILIFALFWNLISSCTLFVIPDEIRKGNYAALIALIFPLIGLFLLGIALRSFLVLRRYGTTVLHLASTPGVLGGYLNGAVQLKTRIDPEAGFPITLRCVRETVTGSGKNRSTQRHILWEQRKTVSSGNQGDPFSTLIPVQFSIPYDLPQSDRDNSRNRVLWEVEIKAGVPGVDYNSTFEVPVFQTSESDPKFVIPEEQERFHSAEALETEAEAVGLHLTPLGGDDIELVFPAARNKGSAVGLTVFGIIWSGAAVGIACSDAPLLFPLVFGGSAIGILIAGLNMWFRSRRVRIRSGNVQLESLFLGSGKSREYLVADCDRFERTQGMTSGNTVYYDIKLHLQAGGRIKVGGGIADRSLTNHLCAELNKALGKASPAS